MREPTTGRPLVATYRIQLGSGVGFREAAELLDHLQSLGVSHVYTSPVLTATPGSTHGYDVLAHGGPNEELGGEEGFRALVEAAHERGIGIVIDIVPNHMAAHPDNAQWRDVLRFGRSSEYESWFDLEWEPGGADAPDRLLLPVLGSHYGEVVRNGELQLDVAADEPVLRYYERSFPLSVESVVELVRESAGTSRDRELADQAAQLALVAGSPAEAVAQIAQLSAVWADKDGGPVRDLLTAVNADPERLHRVLDQQHYRLAHWRTGTEAISYRRFFDVSDLIGLQTQLPHVFDATHARFLEWVAAGDVDGLRVDHPDGLTDPTGYAQELRRRAPDAWIVVEKILTGRETLPPSWPVDGSTGYETLVLLDRLFVDPAGERPMSEILAEHTGIDEPFPEIEHRAKAEVLQRVLAAEVHRLQRDLAQHERTTLDRVDVSANDAEAVIRAFLTEFPVYRTYTQGTDAADERDSAILDQVRAAVHAHGGFDPAVVDHLAGVLAGPLETEQAIRFRQRFQQTSGPVMAKGVEDTAFYRYPRLISLNEVGSDPTAFGIELDEFHAVQADIAVREPRHMIATSTHDTKRSEDVRARLSVLSEVPDAWRAAVEVFTRRAEALGEGDRDPVLEYLLHQTNVGAHPLDAERAVQHARKAAREAKRSTSWLHPDEDYERRLFASVEAWSHDAEYQAALRTLLDVIERPGRVNSLGLKLLALTLPGVPDIYQGSELWTAEIVDPDNRRPVDFELRRRLGAADANGASGFGLTDEGSAKLQLIRTALRVRREHPAAFAPETGTYEPLYADGAARDHVVAFVRGGEVITAVTRLSVALERAGGWRDTRMELPAGRWTDALSGRACDGSVAVTDLLAANPVALLVRTA